MLGSRMDRRPLTGLLALALAACSPPPPNLVLLSIDTLRPDHLGCYGYPRPTSPAIDALCREARKFRWNERSDTRPLTMISGISFSGKWNIP